MDPDASFLSLIPADVVQQVFVKLPFTELVSLRVVCKRWNSIICCLYLVHQCHVPKCVPVHFLNGDLTVYNSRLKSWEQHSLSFFKNHIRTSQLELVASAGGLLCFETEGRLIVCNPISKSWKLLQIPSRVGEDFMQAPKPDTVAKSEFSTLEMSKRTSIVGLLVDSVTGNYKIIVASLHDQRARPTIVYDSLKCSWKRGAPVPEGQEFSDGDAILCNGCLYCLVKTETCNGKLLRYEVKTHKWSKLSLDMSVMRCKLVEHSNKVLLVKRSSYYSVESAFRFFQLCESHLSMTLKEKDVLESLNLDTINVSKVLGHLKSTGRGTVMGQSNLLYVLKPPYEDGLRQKRTRVTVIDLSTGSCDVLGEMIIASRDEIDASCHSKRQSKNVFHLFSASITVQV